MGTDGAQMPKYRSHKEVWALQIDRVEFGTDAIDNPGPKIYFIERYGPVDAEPYMFSRYMPVHGDYYVVYDDGYKSISPQAVFESGYTRI